LRLRRPLARVLDSHRHLSSNRSGYPWQVALFRNGLYQVVYCTIGHAERVCDQFIASVRNGAILGSDGHGGLYLGRDDAGPQELSACVQMVIQVPPDGELITGLTAGPGGGVVSLNGLLDATADRQKTIVEIAGEAIEIEIDYLGPLPD
jgi:hypothetical protein